MRIQECEHGQHPTMNVGGPPQLHLHLHSGLHDAEPVGRPAIAPATASR
jgi:hypothetical protein